MTPAYELAHAGDLMADAALVDYRTAGVENAR
jgi:hypothetical protein